MIKFEKATKTYSVSFSKRHPVTRKPYSLRRKAIKTKTEANQVYASLIVEVHKKFKETVVPNWSTLVKEYIEALGQRDISKKTIESYWLGLRAHTFNDWGNRLIDSITSKEIRELIPIKVGNRSASHQKNVLKYIRSAFEYALEAGYIDRNPTPKMKFKIGDKIKSALTESQVRTLLTQAKLVDIEWYPVWAMALYTGMRNGELYALTWDKVDLESRRIKVDSSWSKQDGYKDTKSGDDRIVEIAPNLICVLRELKIKNSDSNFVLPRIDKWDRGEQARELRRFLEGVGLPRVRFHDLRATWATIMLSKGIAPIKVMMAGGWKDLKTLQIYVRKSGVSISGISDCLKLHDPSTTAASLLSFKL
ncbi:MAG: site-specific integrase [Bacteriovoracaceae bacterium]|jgi:integrase|nr:site-specific integrase [Bacteriovoracaceae bacterium]